MTTAAATVPQYLFEEFFEMGQQETTSPFLKPTSRPWGAYLELKASLLAALLLILAFAMSWHSSLLPVASLLLVFVYFLAGMPALIQTIADLSLFDVNIDMLMTLAAFSSVLIGSPLEGGLLLVLFAISGAMEDAVTAKAKGAIGALHKLTPTKACVVTAEGMLLDRAIADIEVGTVILVKAGQVVPLDGQVIGGSSSVDMVHLTGESVPVTKEVGDHVAAGARTIEGALTLKITHTSSDSTMARIIELVTRAQETKPQLQQWFDKLSRSYALTIMGVAAAAALLLPLVISIPFLGVEGSLYRALAFLIAASPCALIIAIPIAYLSAIGSCARHGILPKGGLALEALARCRAIAFDKTGTLTTGELSCLGMTPLDSKSSLLQEKALAAACSLERGAVHPIARALIAYGQEMGGQERGLPYLPIDNFHVIAGHGVAGSVMIDGVAMPVFLGHPAFIAGKVAAETGVTLLESAKTFQEQGELLAAFLMGQELYLFRFTDTIRATAQATVAQLQSDHNLQILMLTGDHIANAEKVAKTLAIATYYAELRPEDKLHHVSRWADRWGLAMVGDGINDAPALARATVGICMGKIGSATAAEAADIILLHDNIEKLNWLVHKAHKTHTIVRENLFLAIAAMLGASIPALLGLVPLWLAVLLHEGGTVLVGLNGLRLLRGGPSH